MPHLMIRGVPAERLQAVALPMVKQLAELCECGTDNFTLNCLNTIPIIVESPDNSSFAFIEVGWFERGQEVRDRFAQIITQTILELDILEVEVAFTTYREDGYYINGTAVK